MNEKAEDNEFLDKLIEYLCQAIDEPLNRSNLCPLSTETHWGNGWYSRTVFNICADPTHDHTE